MIIYAKKSQPRNIYTAHININVLTIFNPFFYGFKVFFMSLNPFYIKTAQGAGTDNQASDINSNYPNGAINGVVSWTPATAGTYYYQCSAHDGMYGTITVQ